MIVTLDTARLRSVEQVAAFMEGTAAVGFSPPPASERYGWIGRKLSQFAYQGCDRRQRGLLRRIIARATRKRQEKGQRQWQHLKTRAILVLNAELSKSNCEYRIDLVISNPASSGEKSASRQRNGKS